MIITLIMLPLVNVPPLYRVLLVPHVEAGPVFEWVGDWRKIELTLSLFFDNLDIWPAKEKLEDNQIVTCQFEEDPSFLDSTSFNQLFRFDGMRST